MPRMKHSYSSVSSGSSSGEEKRKRKGLTKKGFTSEGAEAANTLPKLPPGLGHVRATKQSLKGKKTTRSSSNAHTHLAATSQTGSASTVQTRSAAAKLRSTTARTRSKTAKARPATAQMRSALVEQTLSTSAARTRSFIAAQIRSSLAAELRSAAALERSLALARQDQPDMFSLLQNIQCNVMNRKYSTREEIESLSSAELGINFGMDFELDDDPITVEVINPDAERFKHIEIQDGKSVTICTFFPDTEEDETIKIIEYTDLQTEVTNQLLAANGFPVYYY